MTAIDINTITTLIAVAGPVGSVFVLGWWLSGRFRRVEIAQRDRADRLEQTTRERADEIAETTREQIRQHEKEDERRHEENLGRFDNIRDRGQQRHEDNMERFRTISVSLAELGASNGSVKGH